VGRQPASCPAGLLVDPVISLPLRSVRLVLGQGLVDGSASTRPGDLGQLRFRQPAGSGPGW
jgi:hypothetical protein